MGCSGSRLSAPTTEGERYFLFNSLLFAGNDHGANSDFSTAKNPVQAFSWGDYTAKPGHTYPMM
jgi:hypothetical protein